MPYPGFPTDMQSIMAATFTIAKGTTIVVENIFENRYKYVQELNKMGAKITVEGKSAIIRGVRKIYGATVKATGTNEIEIEGVKKLKEISYNVMPDRIESGTFLCLAAITGGKIKLEKTNPNHLTPIIAKLEEAGCEIKIQKEEYFEHVYLEVFVPKNKIECLKNERLNNLASIKRKKIEKTYMKNS